ncbi:MAG TPA: polyribonucleotide nucleotidyltransferase [Acidimicrobiia bacterium]|nr:polyribonucleotide nucleotidyltransferase [Acidimicrobiia bacterium]
MPEITVSGEVGGKTLTFSTGKLAGQADGAVVAKLGGTEMLVTATANKTLREGIDFFPLTVDFEERMYAVGRIPGSFFRREGRPSEEAILTCRLIDRPLRPSFPDDYRCETHIVVTSLSVDGENPFDVVALNGASAALAVSPIPFNGPVGAVRLALKKGEWIPFPTEADLDESVFELVVAGRRNAQGQIDIMMVEAGATPNGLRLVAAGDPPSDEAAVSAALEEAKPYISDVIDLIAELASQVEKPHVEWPRATDYTPEVYDRIAEIARPKLHDIIRIPGKQERNDAADRAFEETLAEMGVAEDDVDTKVQAARAFKSILKEMMRQRVVDEGVRLDGRGPRDLRPLSAEVGVIERAHGSGLFQRGETQVLNITTLGMLKMEQLLDTLAPEESKRYMHHYNFPPFSTGEAGFMRGPKRREIGHGALAEKAVLPVVPDADEFPYALRLVSEVLSSNGSTSMASVCASSLSLMDAGVPISEPVAGIAMGLIHRDGQFVTLTDILGAEDALGDMDFKVAGTADVITALQLDTKIEGLPSEVLSAALDQAKEARLQILEVMRQAIPEPRQEMNPYAPRIESVEIPKDKIGEVIGPKGAVVRELEAETGATIEIDEADGKGIVRIASNDGEILRKTKERILQIAFPPQPEVGAEYEGEVVNITKFGAFVNILPGTDGLLHISKLDASKRVERVEDYLDLGDKVKVRVGGIDRGKLSLDLVEALPGATLPEPGGNGGGEGGRGGEGRDRGDRGDRGDRRGGRNRDRGRGGDRDRGRDRGQGGGGGAGQGERRRVARSFEETFEDNR